MPYPFFVILLFLSHFRLNSNSLNINILHPNSDNTLELKSQENDRKFLFISLNSSTLGEKTKNITNFNENTYIFQNPHKSKNESNDNNIAEIKNTIFGILTKIKNSFDFTENDQGKRCLLVLMLVVLTIVMCCLALQVIISVTKNCKLALNEIAARERKFGMINDEKPSF